MTETDDPDAAVRIAAGQVWESRHPAVWNRRLVVAVEHGIEDGDVLALLLRDDGTPYRVTPDRFAVAFWRGTYFLVEPAC